MPTLRALLVGMLLVAGCAPEPRCSAEACPTGCCDAQGLCQLGTEDTACGKAGACAACNNLGSCDPDTRTCRQSLKPQAFLVVTRSGNTAQPLNAADPNCPTGCGAANACPAACPTRLSAIKSAVNAFAASNATDAWLSLAVFGTTSGFDACGPTQSSDVLVVPGASESDSASDMTSRASSVAAKLQNVTSGGGTSLGPSLQFLAGQANLAVARRKNYVVVLTGLPNCNGSNPSTCMGSQCRCTVSSCSGSLCAQGCLDEDGTAKGIAALVAKKAIPILIGVGPELDSTDGRALLDTLAKGSPYRRPCKFPSDCGTSDTCTAGVCGRSYYLATTQTEIAQAMAQVAGAINP